MWDEGFSSILPMWDIPLTSGCSSKKRGSYACNQMLRFMGLVRCQHMGLQGSHSWFSSTFALTLMHRVLTQLGGTESLH